MRGKSRSLRGRVATLPGDAQRTARFLREHRRFCPRADDVFVATYPRSGTTWLQYACFLMLHPDRMQDEEPPFAHISDVAPWYERSFSVGLAQARDFERLPSPRVFKTHLPRQWLPPTVRCVYAVRAAEDVVLSYWHLYRSHLGYRDDLDTFFEDFVSGRLQYGTWKKHVAGWAQAAAFDRQVHWIRYETLRARPFDELRRLATFLDVNLDEVTLERVVRNTAFDTMKLHRTRFDHATERDRTAQGTDTFIRKGQVGEGHAALSPSQRERLASQSVPLFSAVELDLPLFLR